MERKTTVRAGAVSLSIGASTANGFFTAGHCVNPTDAILLGQLQYKNGDAISSAYNYFIPFRDTAWVQAVRVAAPKLMDIRRVLSVFRQMVCVSAGAE